MPFVKVDPVAEAVELQELFKDEPETKEMFRQYELAHRDNENMHQEEQELKNRLVAKQAARAYSRHGNRP